MSQNFDETKSKLSECKKILDTLDGAESSVQAEYYRVCGDMYKVNSVLLIIKRMTSSFVFDQVKADYGAYYRTSLLYLSCLPKPLSLELSQPEIIQRAHDLGVSALLAETVYNFGELVSVKWFSKAGRWSTIFDQLLHPIFGALDESSGYDWLKNLLLAFNSGDIGKFEALSPFIAREVTRLTNPSRQSKADLEMDLLNSQFFKIPTVFFDRRSVWCH
jgi:26S proteasome regulatory subunit N9